MPARWKWVVAAAALAGGALFSARHSLPDLLALVDRGPPAIPATSFSERLAAERNRTTKAQGKQPKAVARVSFDKPANADVRPIVIASWTFAAPDLAVAEEPEQTWRTSFGSERKRDPRVGLAAGFTADLVIVTGIRDFQTLRRVFPMRDYFTITSPQLTNLALIQAGSAKPFVAPAVAVVIRRGSGVRSGRRVQLEFVMSEAETVLSGGPQDLVAAGPSTSSLPFAVQIHIGRSRFWVVAHDRTAICQGDAQCESETTIRNRLAEWLDARKQDGDTMVIVERADRPAPPIAGPDISIGRHGGVALRDSGCQPANLALYGWAGAAGGDILASAETIWRTRPSGGDCVLLTRIEVPAQQRDDADIAGVMREDSTDADTAGLPVDAAPAAVPAGATSGDELMPATADR